MACVGTPAIASDWVEDQNTQSFRIAPRSPSEIQVPVQGHAPAGAPELKVMYQGDSAPRRKILPLQGNVSSIIKGTEGLDGEASDVFKDAPIAPYPAPKNVGPGTFKIWLQATHPGLPLNAREAIVEVKGQWDDSGHILHNFGFGFTKIAPNSLIKTDLHNTAVMIVDCAGELNQPALDIVREFVGKGGYLVTTDWALDNCLVRAIPGALEWNGGYSYPDIVDAVVVSKDPDLTKGLSPIARWKLDGKCQIVRVRAMGEARVLVRSRLLLKSDPDGLGILAATFDYGKGKVLHVVGHFDNNSTGAFNTQLPDPAPNMGISLRQGLVTNFIVMGLKAHTPPSSSVAAKSKATDEVKEDSEKSDTPESMQN